MCCARCLHLACMRVLGGGGVHVGIHTHVHVLVSKCVCVCARARSRACACLHAFMRVCVCVCVCLHCSGERNEVRSRVRVMSCCEHAPGRGAALKHQLLLSRGPYVYEFPYIYSISLYIYSYIPYVYSYMCMWTEDVCWVFTVPMMCVVYGHSMQRLEGFT